MGHHPAHWSQTFDDPIPDREPLTTLRQAGEYITALPATEQRQAHWQLATQILPMVAEGHGPPMFAHIAMLRALRHGEPSPPPRPRKKPAKIDRIIKR